MKQRGFTLLEVMVATLIMAIAVTGLLSALSTSMRNAAKLTDYDRATLMARQKMDELLMTKSLPKNANFGGAWDPAATGGLPMGWQAHLSTFESYPGARALVPMFERVQLQIWWMSGAQKRTLSLDGFRRTLPTPEEFGAGHP